MVVFVLYGDMLTLGEVGGMCTEKDETVTDGDSGTKSVGDDVE